MKNNQLLAMYRMYFTIIIVAGLLILIISNIYVLNKFDQEKNKNITEIMQNMSVRKDYIEKGMVLMFNNVYLQRNFIEDSLSNLSSAVPLDNFYLCEIDARGRFSCFVKFYMI